jgi:hypothetical protein
MVGKKQVWKNMPPGENLKVLKKRKDVFIEVILERILMVAKRAIQE